MGVQTVVMERFCSDIVEDDERSSVGGCWRWCRLTLVECVALAMVGVREKECGGRCVGEEGKCWGLGV